MDVDIENLPEQIVVCFNYLNIRQIPLYRKCTLK